MFSNSTDNEIRFNNFSNNLNGKNDNNAVNNPKTINLFYSLSLSHICYIIYIDKEVGELFKIIYFTRNNKCPILDFFEKIPKKDVAKILRDIDLLEEFGLSLGMPYIKKMSGTKDIWELRLNTLTT